MLVSPIRHLSIASALWLVACAAAPQQQEATTTTTISRDVLILGGGAAGTYAGVQLKDQGRSVAVVERSDVLGGRTHTLRFNDDDGDGNEFIDYGVLAYFGDDLTKNFLKRLDVEYEPAGLNSLINHKVDFTTGESIPQSALLDVLGLIPGALLYRGALEQYEFLRDGTFDLPDPVPDILLRPFREFVEKHKLHGALEVILMFTQNVGDILNQPAWLVIRDFCIPHIDTLVGRGYIRPKNGVGTVYEKAARVLGADVLYQTTVAELTRSEDGGGGGVNAVIQGPDGERTRIQAKKLLLGIPPTLTNLASFDLDEREGSLFQQWQHLSYYVAVVNDTGLPNKVNVVNNDPTNKPGQLPRTPFQWHLDYAGVPDHHVTKLISSDANFTAQEARDQIAADILRMGEAGTYETRDPNFVAFGSHTPITIHPNPEALQAGFYRELYRLQGHRDTFYSGLAFVTDYTSPIWKYTDKVLSQMVF